MRITTLIVALMLITPPAAAQNPYSVGVKHHLGPQNQDQFRVGVKSSSARAQPNFNRKCYELYFEAGQRAVVDLKAPPIGHKQHWDPYLVVNGPNSYEDAANDQGKGIHRRDARLDFTAKTNGIYRICATSFDPFEQGPYFFRVWQTPQKSSPPNPAKGIGVRINGNLNVFCNDPLPGNKQRSTPEYFREEFTFTMTQDHINKFGSTVRIDVTYDFEGMIYLVAPDNNVITYDDSRGNKASRIEHWCNTLGTWRVILTSDAPGVGGNYVYRTSAVLNKGR